MKLVLWPLAFLVLEATVGWGSPLHSENHDGTGRDNGEEIEPKYSYDDGALLRDNDISATGKSNGEEIEPKYSYDDGALLRDNDETGTRRDNGEEPEPKYSYDDGALLRDIEENEGEKGHGFAQGNGHRNTDFQQLNGARHIEAKSSRRPAAARNDRFLLNTSTSPIRGTNTASASSSSSSSNTGNRVVVTPGIGGPVSSTLVLGTPVIFVVVKAGHCPPVRPVCPNLRNFEIPAVCLSDSRCGGLDKCCFDTCLQQRVCKPPVGIGR